MSTNSLGRRTFDSPIASLNKGAISSKGFETPEEWRDLSVQLKQFSPEYIGTVDNLMLDSIQFGPYPAAMAGFVVITEVGDTAISLISSS